jgi:DNA polymerase-4
LTFDRDVSDLARLQATLLDLAESIASRLRNHHLAAGGVQLKLRYEGFETLIRQMPLLQHTSEAKPLHAAGLELLHKTLASGRSVRLIGLTAINLTDARQLTLFDAGDRTDRLTRSIDEVRKRFGEKAITRARLIGLRDRRRFDFGERPKAPGDEGEKP